jgi:N-acyl homoserine lactone hydrolase
MQVVRILASLCVLVVLLASCEQEQRVPYIRPELAQWPEGYRGVEGLRVQAFVTGWLVSQTTMLQTPPLPVLGFAIHHPTRGVVLFGTGLGEPQLATPELSLRGVLDLIADVRPEPGLDLVAALAEGGIAPDAVGWVVLSSLRFTQTGGLEKFPGARAVVDRREHAHAQETRAGYRRADFDDVANWRFIDFPLDAPLATFRSHVDLFEDGSCLLIDAAGYTPGTMALLVRLPSAPLLLAGEMAFRQSNVLHAVRPRAAFEADSWWDRIWRLKRFGELEPRLVVLPGYDVEPIWRLAIPELVLQDFTRPATQARPPDPRRRPGYLRQRFHERRGSRRRRGSGSAPELSDGTWSSSK